MRAQRAKMSACRLLPALCAAWRRPYSCVLPTMLRWVRGVPDKLSNLIGVPALQATKKHTWQCVIIKIQRRTGLSCQQVLKVIGRETKVRTRVCDARQRSAARGSSPPQWSQAAAQHCLRTRFARHSVRADHDKHRSQPWMPVMKHSISDTGSYSTFS